MRLIADGIRPRDICTRKAFENAAIIVAATGGSTNGALHLPAMANEVGIDFDLFDVAEILRERRISPILSPAESTWPRTSTTSAACRRSSRRCWKAEICTAIA